MSASEKLKALEVGITAGEWRANERYPSSLTVGGEFSFSGRMRTEADAQFCAALANALPQIVAVVEAAEELRPLDHDAMCAYYFDPFGTKPCNCSKGRTDASLTALEEAL